MKFLAYYSVVLFYFLCSAETALELESPVSVSTVSNPIIPLIPCTLIVPLLVYLAAACKLAAIGIKVSPFLACEVFDFPYPFGAILSGSLNSINDGSKVGGAPCSQNANLFIDSIQAYCPKYVIPATTILAELANQGKLRLFYLKTDCY